MPPPDARIAQAARLHQAKNYPAAEQAYRHVLSHQPNHPDALLLMGMLLHETGRHEDAIDTLRRGIAVHHRPVELRRALVGPLVAVGDVTAAIEQAQQVARLTPTAAEAHLIVAQLIARTGDAAGAEPHARRAAELAPTSAPAWLILARALANTGRPTDALAAFDRAIVVAPTFADVVIERAYLLQSNGRLAEAIAGYEQGLRLAPTNLAALNNIGACHLMSGRPAEAVQYFEAAARLQPEQAKPRNNIGAALKEAGRIDDALPHLIEAARLDPAYSGPPSNIGACYATVADHGRAVEAYRHAEAVDPAFDAAGSNVLLSLLAAEDVPAEALRAESVAWGRRYADPVGLSPPAITDPSPTRRLRVGYVSPDFREHSVRYFIEPVLAAHDRAAVEVFCYAAGPRRDEASLLLAKRADHWVDVAGLSAEQLADRVRNDGIDVLVDLAGHTSENRLLTFARRPAPVQATWLGYPATTGVAAIGYRLTDAVADPPGAEAAYVERLIRLPTAFFVYADDAAKPYEPKLPADANGHVTFGSFNSYTKVTPATLATWAGILAAVPGSRLLMKAKPLENPSTRAAVVAAFAAAGVAESRLDLRTWVPLPEHFALLAGVDLMLDTFPYNGHTTTCQALWMGAPTLTRHGDEFRGRVGLSLWTQLGLPEFATASADEYARRAVQLATDLTALRDLRPTWRDRMRRSPLCDAAGFTRGLEAAYLRMWAAAVESAE